MKRAERADRVKDLGITSLASIKHHQHHFASSDLNQDDLDDTVFDPDEAIQHAVLLDTMLLHAYMHCQPPHEHRQAVLKLLSASNRCQIESCAVLLASYGNAYTEALLWLYRSQHQHARVLQALSEDKCVAIGKQQLVHSVCGGVSSQHAPVFPSVFTIWGLTSHIWRSGFNLAPRSQDV